MPDVLSSILELTGLILVVAGLWMIYPPVGMIALGAVLIAAGFTGDES